MSKLLEEPTRILAAGNKPNGILEYFGRIYSRTGAVSIVKMRRPARWVEPGHTPEFDECTVVSSGGHVAARQGHVDVAAEQAELAPGGVWVQYSTPGAEGAEYAAVCLPAFGPETAHRDA